MQTTLAIFNHKKISKNY